MIAHPLGSFIENRERIISVRTQTSFYKKHISFFGKSIMNTCCNEWRNWRFLEGVHERKKKKIGTYFHKKAIEIVFDLASGSNCFREKVPILKSFQHQL